MSVYCDALCPKSSFNFNKLSKDLKELFPPGHVLVLIPRGIGVILINIRQLQVFSIVPETHAQVVDSEANHNHFGSIFHVPEPDSVLQDVKSCFDDAEASLH